MACLRGSTTGAAILPLRHPSNPPIITALSPHYLAAAGIRLTTRWKIRASMSSGGGGGGSSESYLEMWKEATNRHRREMKFHRIADNPAPPVVSDYDDDESEEEKNVQEDLERKNSEFKKILQVPREERDKAQRMQVIDRAAAAIAAARAILEENNPPAMTTWKQVNDDDGQSAPGFRLGFGMPGWNSYSHHPKTSANERPGPDFWSWIPPPVVDLTPADSSSDSRKTSSKSVENTNQLGSLMEKDRSADHYLAMPFETGVYETNLGLHLPPFQSSMLEKQEEKEDFAVNFPVHSAEAAEALTNNKDEDSCCGINPDGSRWWKETGMVQRPDAVVCRWTLTRGVSADGVVEWENKYWEAVDQLGYKELGSEKSGRDAKGDVWHEYWKESLWQERGLLHIEKTAEKWGKNGGEEWQEKWREIYDASGRADKWAHKWCSVDPSSKLEAGHAHVWHERWGETYDGRGGSIKYTDKWAERHEGNGWTKWGDKWDERFNLNGHGVKQGETWWEGVHGERWNRTWGEKHDSSGWVHKYGKSSSGEHWDTHVQEGTWYEKYPHFGFFHCLENSVQLREVSWKPSDVP